MYWYTFPIISKLWKCWKKTLSDKNEPNYMGSDIGIVIIVPGRRILVGKPWVFTARYDPCSHSLIVLGKNHAVLLPCINLQHDECLLHRQTSEGIQSAPTLIELNKWRRRVRSRGLSTRLHIEFLCWACLPRRCSHLARFCLERHCWCYYGGP